jgi:hypothetical protein
LGEAQSVLDSREPVDALGAPRGRGESGGEPEVSIFWAVSEEDWVNCVEERFYARHVDALRVTESADIACEDPTAFDK